MTQRTKCAHDVQPGDFDLPKGQSYLALDRDRQMCISAWLPKCRINEAAMITVEGMLLWGRGERESKAVDCGGDNWIPGDTEPPMEKIKLNDGRELWCYSWKVEPAGKDVGRVIGDTSRRKKPEGASLPVYVTMECYLMTEDDIKGGSVEEFTD